MGGGGEGGGGGGGGSGGVGARESGGTHGEVEDGEGGDGRKGSLISENVTSMFRRLSSREKTTLEPNDEDDDNDDDDNYVDAEDDDGDALWSGTNKNRDVSTGPLACPFIRPFAPLARLLVPDCSLRTRPPLRSLIRSLALSLPRSWESELLMSQNDLVLSHSATTRCVTSMRLDEARRRCMKRTRIWRFYRVSISKRIKSGRSPWRAIVSSTTSAKTGPKKTTKAAFGHTFSNIPGFSLASASIC